MKRMLYKVEAQICPFPTQTRRELRLNGCSDLYLHEDVDCILLQKNYNAGHDLKVLSADAELSWDFGQYTDKPLPHYNRFEIIPRFIESLQESPRSMKCIALMHLARGEVDKCCAHDFIARALDKGRSAILPMTSIEVQKKV